jgi:hypothetical protein
MQQTSEGGVSKSMSAIGIVESLWRYPVKSMRGEEIEKAFVGFSGIYGDRQFAIKRSEGRKGFPYLTGRDQREMLKYRPQFRFSDQTTRPPNLEEAEAIGPGITPIYGDSESFAVDVQTPSGEVLSLDDPKLLGMLSNSDAESLTVIQSARALTDCRPLSLISLQTVTQLGNELNVELDKRRFRANFYLDLTSSSGFDEDAYVGRAIKIGSKVVISILERDPRCAMINLDPETGESNPEMLQSVFNGHEGKAGVYAAVLVEGRVEQGDVVELLD